MLLLHAILRGSIQRHSINSYSNDNGNNDDDDVDKKSMSTIVDSSNKNGKVLMEF